MNGNRKNRKSNKQKKRYFVSLLTQRFEFNEIMQKLAEIYLCFTFSRLYLICIILGLKMFDFLLNL